MRLGLLLGGLRCLGTVSRLRLGSMSGILALRMRCGLGSVPLIAWCGMGTMIAVVATIEFAHLIPGVPFTTGDSSREGHGQSCGPNSQCHAQPVTRFAFEATVST